MKERLEHDYAIAAWSLSLLPERCSDVSKNFDGEKRLIVECIIEKLHHPPCPNPTITAETMTEIIDMYQKEQHYVDKKSGIFAI